VELETADAKAGALLENLQSGPRDSVPLAEITALAKRYENTRKNLPSGRERSFEMTDIVGEMMAKMEYSDVPDIIQWLKEEQRGLRLAAYAYLYTKPDNTKLIQLVESVLRSDNKPFEQYWDLRALRKIKESNGHLDLNSQRRLRELSRKLLPGSDRAYELRLILDEQ
jgi:hypothetical protein